jgi:hypothetical protein
MKSELTAERLRKLLYYCPDTGRFYWKVHRGSALPQTEAGNCGNDGYRRIVIDGRSHRAHRLAWLYVYGEHPIGVIDHDNQNPSDNRIANLRDGPPAVNAENRRKRGQSGFLGVRRCGSKWVARIGVNGESLHLGTYDSPKKAAARYERAARLLHGSFFSRPDAGVPAKPATRRDPTPANAPCRGEP